jgi:flagellar basal-body rod modification protein FlgD
MAIENGVVTSAFNTLGTTGTNIGEDQSVLGKDDFLQLLLVELQNQDPTDPQDTDKILQQTSQLATLEASQNTNDALTNLSQTMTNSSYYSTVSSIGKMASLGADGLILEDGVPIEFDVYFPEDITSAEVTLTNDQGIAVETLELSAKGKGSTTLNWDAVDNSGNSFEDGKYTVAIQYTTTSGETKEGQFGVFPIEAVRFNGEEPEFKLGNTYMPMSLITEIYNQ